MLDGPRITALTGFGGGLRQPRLSVVSVDDVSPFRYGLLSAWFNQWHSLL